MKSQCLPFTQIPHTTPLFIDFLSHVPAVRNFYPQGPDFQEWFKNETARLRYDAGRRERLATILDRQNKAWSASSATLENIARFRAGACAIVTGQQVGLFGGPLFSVFKALTAVKLAQEATAGGVEAVPIFWLATEDHDLAEVNHAGLPAPDGSLARIETSSSGATDAPVGTIKFGAEIEPVVQQAAELLGGSGIADLLRDAYRPGETLGSAFARLFARWFADWGVILLDASDPDLHAIVAPIYRAAIERAADLDEALLSRGSELESGGYHQQVKVTPSSTLLFSMQDGARIPVHRRSNGSQPSQFVIGEEKVSESALLERIGTAPQRFSANVLLRPVVQDYLLPTLAYTGGSAEVAYFAQAAVVYKALLGRVTPIVARFSATLVEPKAQRLLEKYRLSLPDLFRGPEVLRETLASRALPSDLQSAFDKARAGLDNSLGEIRNSLARLDATLVDAADRAGSKMFYQLDHLRSSAARAELRQSELLARHAELLSNSLYPEKTLQEREIAGVYFLSRYGPDLLHQVYETMHTDCHDHQVIEL